MKKIIYTLFSFSFALVMFSYFNSAVIATDLTISDNGEGSNSSIDVSQNQSQTTNQDNNANVNNNVNTDNNTGDNEANDNNGDASITTGNSDTTTDVTNTANNSTVNSANCCIPNDSSVTVSGNLEGSTNTVTVDNNSTIEVTVRQNATINNSVRGNANTGRNSANDNSGSVDIHTGDITARQSVKNKNINNADVSVGSPNHSYTVKIIGNGRDSVNSVSVNNQNSVSILVLNTSALNNLLEFYANTGDNEANNNFDNVSITTGDIVLDNLIKNEDINISKVTVDCGCESLPPGENPPPPGGGPNPPNNSQPPSNNPPGSNNPGPTTSGGQGGGPGPAGEILGLAAQIMPATGPSWILILTLLAALMFVLGLYLRFHPGQDPGERFLRYA